MKANNVIIHYYPLSPFIAKAQINFRWDSRITFSLTMLDDEACRNYLKRQGWDRLKTRAIVHC